MNAKMFAMKMAPKAHSQTAEREFRMRVISRRVPRLYCRIQHLYTYASCTSNIIIISSIRETHEQIEKFIRMHAYTCHRSNTILGQWASKWLTYVGYYIYMYEKLVIIIIVILDHFRRHHQCLLIRPNAIEQNFGIPNLPSIGSQRVNDEGQNVQFIGMQIAVATTH